MITEFIIGILFFLHYNLSFITRYLLQFKVLSTGFIIYGIKNSKYEELIRIITFNLFHSSLEHLLTNSITFINYGIPLQNHFNNYSKFLYPKIILALIFLSGIFYTLIYYIVFLITQDFKYYDRPACGFSCVLFGLQYIYYCISYNDKILALKRTLIHLIYINTFIQNSSLVGHLSGLLGGIVVTKALELN